jgi:hypothetical protein
MAPCVVTKRILYKKKILIQIAAVWLVPPGDDRFLASIILLDFSQSGKCHSPAPQVAVPRCKLLLLLFLTSPLQLVGNIAVFQSFFPVKKHKLEKVVHIQMFLGTS